MADEKEFLLLKWGVPVQCKAHTEATHKALDRYNAAGVSFSAMAQPRTPEHIEAACALCDAVEAAGGTIQNDWTGEVMNAEAAKQYLRNYRKAG